MSRLLVAVLAATSALALSACTGLQGGSEPPDDGSSESTVGYVADEYGLSFDNG
jgi:hypothetical protein